MITPAPLDTPALLPCPVCKQVGNLDCFWCHGHNVPAAPAPQGAAPALPCGCKVDPSYFFCPTHQSADAHRAPAPAAPAPGGVAREHSEELLGMAKLVSELEEMAKDEDPEGYMVSSRWVLTRLKSFHDARVIETKVRNPLHEAPAQGAPHEGVDPLTVEAVAKALCNRFPMGVPWTAYREDAAAVIAELRAHRGTP